MILFIQTRRRRLKTFLGGFLILGGLYYFRIKIEELLLK